MRTLKVQMQITLDGIVGGTAEPTPSNWDEEIRSFAITNLNEVDAILLGSQTAPELVTHWGNVAQDASNEDYAIGKRITEIPKIVISRSITSTSLPNTSVRNGPLATEIERLKQMPGKDMIVYGGARFVSSLIKENLVDEYDLLVNPVVAGNGLGIFRDVEHPVSLRLIEVRPFSSGTALMRYRAR